MVHTVNLVIINPGKGRLNTRGTTVRTKKVPKLQIKVTNANVTATITIWHQLVMSREECVFQNHNNVNLLYFIIKVHLIIILNFFYILEKCISKYPFKIFLHLFKIGQIMSQYAIKSWNPLTCPSTRTLDS